MKVNFDVENLPVPKSVCYADHSRSSALHSSVNSGSDAYKLLGSLVFVYTSSDVI
jgi:hypothetical protein